MRDERHRQADGHPRDDGCRPPGQPIRQIENSERRERRHQTDHGDRAEVPGHGIHRQQQRRQARRMDGVDLPVLPALHEVGTKLAGEKRSVVAALMVVPDGEVAVSQQALRDHQVMRLVAAQPVGLHGVEAEHQVDGQAGDEDRSTARAKQRLDPPASVDQPAEHAHNRERRNRPAQRPRQDQQQRRAIREPREIRHDPQPEQRARRNRVRDMRQPAGPARAPDVGLFTLPNWRGPTDNGCDGERRGAPHRKLPGRRQQRETCWSADRPTRDVNRRGLQPRGYSQGLGRQRHRGRLPPPGPPARYVAGHEGGASDSFRRTAM